MATARVLTSEKERSQLKQYVDLVYFIFKKQHDKLKFVLCFCFKVNRETGILPKPKSRKYSAFVYLSKGITTLPK